MAGFVKPRLGAALIAVIALGDLLSVDAAHLQPKPREGAPGTERLAAVDWLLAQQHPTDRFIPSATGPFRLHNAGMTYGLESAGGYDSVSVWRYVNLLQIINTGAPYPKKTLADDLAAGLIKRFTTPLVDLLNVRWGRSPPRRPRPSGSGARSVRPPGAPPMARHEELLGFAAARCTRTRTCCRARSSSIAPRW